MGAVFLSGAIFTNGLIRGVVCIMDGRIGDGLRRVAWGTIAAVAIIVAARILLGIAELVLC